MSHPAYAKGWKVCAGFPAYEISFDGNVRRRIDGVTRKAGHIIKGCPNSSGYLVVKLTRPSGVKRVVPIHRLVALTFLGDAPSAIHQVAHWDGDCRNNRADNLRWATPKENAGDDRIRHGRSPRGERNGRSLLTEAQVREIRRRHATFSKEYGGAAKVCREYGISHGALSAVVERRTWKHA